MASSFSGCVHKDKNKVVVAVPTEAETVHLFEKTLIGGFSGVNTRLAFDTNILFPNKDEKSERQDLKIVYSTKNNGKSETKRIVSKIPKMGENNQYGNAMTKPLPYGCIKKQKEVPYLRKFNLIFEDMPNEDKIEHLFIVDIKFNKKLADEKVLLSNEIYTLSFGEKS